MAYPPLFVAYNYELLCLETLSPESYFLLQLNVYLNLRVVDNKHPPVQISKHSRPK